MSSSCFHCSRKIAYVALNKKGKNHHLKTIQDYCLSLPYEVDLFAEEVNSEKKQNSLFKQVLELIHQGEVSELIIPNVSHIMGFNPRYQKEFLDFLQKKQVKLVTLTPEPSRLSLFFRGGI